LGSIEFQDGTKESSIEFFDNLIKENELNIKYSSDVESISSDANHFRVATTDGNIYQAKYVVIAIGSMGKPNRPDYPIPPKIKKVVNFNIDSAINGEKLLVVGGGNSAVEYAIELSKISDDVTLTYRKSRFTRVNPENLHNLNLLVESKKIKLKTAMDIERVSESESGVRVHFQHGDFEDYDRIIYSIGGTVPKEFLRKSGVELDEQSKPILSAEFLTSVPKLYIIGDLALKSGGSIALAINHGYLVAEAIAKESRLT
jgi:thioredoxin reductase (NADPH)